MLVINSMDKPPFYKDPFGDPPRSGADGKNIMKDTSIIKHNRKKVHTFHKHFIFIIYFIVTVHEGAYNENEKAGMTDH